MISMAFCSAASSASSDTMTSAITAVPPGRSTRYISAITRAGSEK
jgi:hypothetical protein